MAKSNKVFVSPGVYTSEKEITYVAQSIGITTLGLVGETLLGPAFEPVLITNFDEFRTYFGPTSPEKFGNLYPKYELPYVAKSYLQESNQLFVTRVLGLTGYKPGRTFNIKTIAGVSYDTESDPAVVSTGEMEPTITGITGSTYYEELVDKQATTSQSVTDYILDLYAATVYTNGSWFRIGPIPESDTPEGTEICGPIGEYNNQNWYNQFFDEEAGYVYSYLFVLSGDTFLVTKYSLSATTNDFGDVTVVALRSRGRYSGDTLTLEVSSEVSLNITSTEIETNPFGEFSINVTGATSGAKTFACTLDSTSSKYIGKVLGKDVFDRDYQDIPLYVFESYPVLTKSLFERGLIRGLSLSFNTKVEGNNFLTEWKTPISPVVVSEVRGGTVANLFQVYTIADGESANYQIKVTISDIDLERGEFNVLVRDFNDTDDNMVILEKYSRCSMNPSLPGYVAKKIGTVDGDYELKSKYIFLVMNPEHPMDAVPAGFKGYPTNILSGATLGGIEYKREYFTAGDETGKYLTSCGEPIIAMTTDKPKRSSLGISSVYGFDYDLLKYKGLDVATEDVLNPLNNPCCNDPNFGIIDGVLYPDGASCVNVSNVVESAETTEGFHLSVNAQYITGNTPSGWAYSTTPYDLEGNDKGDLTTVPSRKFTFVTAGGFDGWDIYRNSRTNSDPFVFGKKNYVNNDTLHGGVFSTVEGNSDYYAYWKGIQTFANPAAIDINVFATPGIDFYNQSLLVKETIDMIENDRADSVYVVNSPNSCTATDVVDLLESVDIDSNYSTTYWPWVQIKDSEQSTQIYIPATGEVLRNIAMTDNVAYPWYAVAGYSRGIVKSNKALKKLTLDDRDTLYQNRINPIATFSDTGTVIWGNKTLQIRESPLDRLNVRRLLLRARKLISAVSLRLLFEQNDEQLRNEFLRLVNPILEAIKRERGVYDFRVTVSKDIEDLDSNTLRGKIYIKPTKSLEYVDIEFVVTPTGASFENV